MIIIRCWYVWRELLEKFEDFINWKKMLAKKSLFKFAVCYNFAAALFQFFIQLILRDGIGEFFIWLKIVDMRKKILIKKTP